MKIVNTQKAITPKVGKPELQLMCSAGRLMVFNVCVSLMKICHVVLKVWSGHENCKYTKGNYSKSRKTRVIVLVFCTSSYGV